MMMKSAALAAFAALGLTSAATAAEGQTKELKHVHESWAGILGHYDQAQLQRGYQVYRTVCASCHSMDLVAFRHLGQKGGPFYLDRCPEGLGIPESTDCSNPVSNPIIKSLAKDYQFEDGPDDAGDMFMRAGLVSDYLPSPYANREQAQAANGGAYPPDMSLLVKARHHGPAYIYSLITGYEEPPETISVPAGQHYNPYYPGDTKALLKPEYVDEEGHVKDGVELPPGGVFKMAAPLKDGVISYEDGSPETVEQYAEDVVAFLQWAAEPKLEQRKSLGRAVLLYLLIFAGIVYFSYKQIWKKVH
ncbi:cytochrome c1 [Parvularcula sp. LCG005]|uniref:cytochrome c1 n=1 Tax=Parvularcula sp. LCG005 TaxID=3078805 RepID=UPI002942C541|nr:cytochrome c1 [Parvularcula sp. LCG005]WOI52515.1 cytochrome c1 [Parvularcula sp. LCG005]